MFDTALSNTLQPALTLIARGFLACGLGANAVTLLGFATGLCAAGLIAFGQLQWGLAMILLSRLLDGVDGALARLSGATDWGGYLDITLDFIFYASIPLAFAWLDPATNALAATTLLFAFMGTASSFLAYAAMAAKRQLALTRSKSLHFLGGLTEAGETLICFSLMCLLPSYFPQLAYGFALLCGVTTLYRLGIARLDLMQKST